MKLLNHSFIRTALAGMINNILNLELALLSETYGCKLSSYQLHIPLGKKVTLHADINVTFLSIYLSI
jgi:hypothetical protein